MMGMIKKDLLMVKNNFKTFLISLALFVMYTVLFDIDMTFFLPFMTFMICMSTLNYDDFNHWHAYAISLPQGRVNVVKSKYVVTTVLTILMTVVGVLFSLGISYYKGTMNLEESISSAVGVLFAVLLLMSILYPILFKFGAEKGRMAMGIIGLSALGITILFTKLVHIEISESIITFLENYLPVLFILASILMLSISYVISKKIYAKKEF